MRYILGCLCLVIMACGASTEDASSNPFKDCKYGKPNAIFSTEIPRVTQHTFEIKGAAAFEHIVFANGRQLEVVQMGCNEIQQEFSFQLPKLEDTSSNAVLEQGTALLSELGSLSDALKPFDFWAGAIRENAAQFKQGKAMQLDKGVFATIDHIPSGSKSLLRVVLEQR